MAADPDVPHRRVSFTTTIFRLMVLLIRLATSLSCPPMSQVPEVLVRHRAQQLQLAQDRHLPGPDGSLAAATAPAASACQEEVGGQHKEMEKGQEAELPLLRQAGEELGVQ